MANFSEFFNFSPIIAFAFAAFLLNLSLGPSIIFATTRGLSDGKIAGILSALGACVSSTSLKKSLALTATNGMTKVTTGKHWDTTLTTIKG